MICLFINKHNLASHMFPRGFPLSRISNFLVFLHSNLIVSNSCFALSMRIRSSTESIQNDVQNISVFIATVLNLFLVFLIIRKSPSLIGPYKYLMIYISVNEILYSLNAVLVSPVGSDNCDKISLSFPDNPPHWLHLPRHLPSR